MPSSKNRIAVKGSERAPLPGAHIAGAIDPNEHILVTVITRRRHSSKELTSHVKEIGARKPHERKHISREEFATTHGADPTDLEKIEDFAHEHGLDVVEAKGAQRRVVLAGTAAAISKAFGVYLARYEHPKGAYRGRTGPVHVPEDIAPIVEGVFGLDNRPQARPHFRHLNNKKGKAVQPRTGEISYTPSQVAQLYDFPTEVNGKNQCIGIIELGGGYQANDLEAYFASLGIPMPRITSVAIDAGTPDGGSNQPTGNPNSADSEVVLDIEVAGAVAPGANIAVYFAGNTDKGFLDAILTAIHDDQRKPSVISISWGSAEKWWSHQAMQAMDQAFQDAAALGVTVCCSAGDDGSSDLRSPAPDDGLLHVDFPGSSPYALCCGGTQLKGQGSTITGEFVWNEGIEGGATGGGVSDEFGLPDYQANANVPPSANPDRHIGRGVPDVAGDADPVTGYQILVDGQQGVIGGTSAVAPLWAGLIALFNQSIGKSVGYLNPVIYSVPNTADVFHDIVSGGNNIGDVNGAYKAGAGWDACTGLGSPDGAKLLSVLSKP
jgi:kumamolisin